MDESTYNSYGKYMKKRFNGRIQKVTVDAKFTCPNRDGTKSTGGCTYCNNESFSTARKVRDLKVKDQLKRGLEYGKSRYKNIVGSMAYFQSYSNTYAPLDYLKELYEEALDVDGIMGLAIGTRPDCVDEDKIAYLEELAKTKEVVIEYGIESIFDESLEKINRCHDYQCFLDAINMTKGRGIKICVHLIIGFPWETKEQWIHTAKELSKLPIDYIKIHQLHILKNTIMGNEYQKKPFKMLTKDAYIEVLEDFLEHLRPSIVVQRLFASSPKEITVSEHWNKTVSDLNAELVAKMLKAGSYQGRLFQEVQ